VATVTVNVTRRSRRAVTIRRHPAHRRQPRATTTRRDAERRHLVVTYYRANGRRSSADDMPWRASPRPRLGRGGTTHRRQQRQYRGVPLRRATGNDHSRQQRRPTLILGGLAATLSLAGGQRPAGRRRGSDASRRGRQRPCCAGEVWRALTRTPLHRALRVGGDKLGRQVSTCVLDDGA